MQDPVAETLKKFFNLGVGGSNMDQDQFNLALEVAGTVVGSATKIDKKTLLIRKGFVVQQGGHEVLALGPDAVFISEELVKTAYWIKLVPAPVVSEPINCDNSRNLIREFLNV